MKLLKILGLIGVAAWLILVTRPPLVADAEKWILPDKPALAHPRLIQTDIDFTALRNDPERVAAAQAAADVFLTKPRTASWPRYSVPLPNPPMPPRHADKEWPYWTPIGAELRMELEALAFGYRLTGDQRYFERVRTLMLSLCGWEQWTDPDLVSMNNNPCLDTFYITVGMSIAYDYLFPDLTTADRETVRRAIIEKGLRFTFRRRDDPTSFFQTPSRWPNGYAMVTAALGIGSLAVWGEETEIPPFLRCAIAKSEGFMREQARDDGALLEGFFYGAASVEPLSLFFSALKKNAGIDLFTYPYFRHAHEFPMYFMIPGSGWLAGFGDNGGPKGTQPLFQGTLSVLAAEGLADGQALWYLQRALNTKEEPPVYLKTIQQGMFYGLRSTSPYREIWPAAVKKMKSIPPSAEACSKRFDSVGWVSLRSGWEDRDALLAFRCGPTIGHAHLDQNGFIIAGRGQVLASDPGYQRFDLKYPDEPIREISHQEHLFTHGSIGHNVILVDGEGQRKVDGVPLDFFSSAEFDYAAGEAAASYPTLRRFTRHVLQMKNPGYFIVLDDIAGDGRPHRIDWLLQAGPDAFFALTGRRLSGNDKGTDNRLRIESGEAALTADFPMLSNPLWHHSQYPHAEKLEHTLSTSFDATALVMLAAFQVHARQQPPLFAFRALPTGGSGIVLLEGRSSDGITDRILMAPSIPGAHHAEGIGSDSRISFIRQRGESGFAAFGMVAGTWLQLGEKPLLMASSALNAVWSVDNREGVLSVSSPQAVRVECLVPGTKTALIDGRTLSASDFSSDANSGIVRLNIPAGDHRVILLPTR